MPIASAVAPLWLAIATAVPPTPPPPAANDDPLPETPVSVRMVRSRAAEVRAASPDAVECTPLPLELARRPEPPIPAQAPAGARIAGSGRTLGILLPKEEKGFPLHLFRRGRVVGEYLLKPPAAGLTLSVTPRLTLGEDGGLVALGGREGFAVYANGVLTTVVDRGAGSASVAFRFGEVMWCPWPTRSPSWHGTPLGKLFKEGEEPPLWLRAELDGSNRQVLARLDPRRLDPEYPNPAEWAMGIAPRRDGKLWLVGLCSGEVWLAGPGGRILRRDPLPVRLRSEEDDEGAMRELEEETLRESRSRPPSGGDVTRRQPKSSVVYVTGGIRVVHKVHARDNDLVVTTVAAQPRRAVILLPADGRPPRCWTLPGPEDFPSIAVTDEELWWLGDGQGGGEDLWHLLWEELVPPGEGAEAEAAAAKSLPPRR